MSSFDFKIGLLFICLLTTQLPNVVYAGTRLDGNILDHRDSVKIEILDNADQSLEIEDILLAENSARFAPFTKSTFNFGMTDRKAIWLRITFTNRNNELKYLEVDNPFLDLVSLYSPDNDNKYHLQMAGDSLPFHTRPTDYRTFVFNLNKSTGQAEPSTYFVKIKSVSNISFIINLWSQDAFLAYSLQDQLLMGLYFGLILIMCLYNLFIFFNLRERTHLYYVIYTIIFSLFIGSESGIAYQYLWPGIPAWAQISTTFFAGSGMLAAFVFTREFLRTWEHTPKLDKIIIFMIVLASVQMLVALSGDVSTAAKIGVVMGLTLPPLIWISGVITWYSGFRPARFLVLSWSFLLVTILIYGLMFIGLLPTTLFTSHAMQIGSAVEVILLSWALADRMAILKQDKEQMQLINLQQLKNHNQMLEQQVSERTSELETLSDLANKRTELLEKTNIELKDMATKDGLTGLLNHHTFIDQFKHLIEDAKRYEYFYSVLLLDIDNFKSINDSFGHLTGNQILCMLADIIRHQIRETDIAVRFGGEEFVVVLSRAKLSEAEDKAEMLRTEMEQLSLTEIPNLKCSISIGVIAVNWEDKGVDYDDVLKQADDAMYQAKEMGKNRIFSKEFERTIISINNSIQGNSD